MTVQTVLRNRGNLVVVQCSPGKDKWLQLGQKPYAFHGHRRCAVALPHKHLVCSLARICESALLQQLLFHGFVVCIATVFGGDHDIALALSLEWLQA